MECDRLADELLGFFSGAGDDAEAGQVWAVGALGLALVFDYDQVFAHRFGPASPA